MTDDDPTEEQIAYDAETTRLIDADNMEVREGSEGPEDYSEYWTATAAYDSDSGMVYAHFKSAHVGEAVRMAHEFLESLKAQSA